MIFEMACYRGTMIWIDGKKSEKGWGCGSEGNTLTSSDLQIGLHRIEAIEVIGPEHDNDWVGTVTGEGDRTMHSIKSGDSNPDAGIFYVFENALIPKEIELRTTNGKWRGPVTEIVTANEDGPEVVKLANGDDYEVDEITIFLRAILQPVN